HRVAAHSWPCAVLHYLHKTTPSFSTWKIKRSAPHARAGDLSSAISAFAPVTCDQLTRTDEVASRPLSGTVRSSPAGLRTISSTPPSGFPAVRERMRWAITATRD